LFDAVLRARFDELRFLETLTTRERPRALVARGDAELRRAREELAPLSPWPGLGDRKLAYEDDHNVVRIRRVLDYLDAHDRVLDVGIGRGYLTGVILRDAHPAYYCGVDIEEKFVASTREMAAENGLDLARAHLECRSLFDIDDAFVARHRPDVVVMLEVLEHLPDPDAAIAHLGRVLPDPTLLVVTVPMLGRFEEVWDHYSVFDTGRIRRIWAAADLSIQYVESVHDTWALVAASRSSEPHPRLERIVATAPSAAAVDRVPSAPPVFHKLSVSSPTEVESTLARHVRARMSLPSRSCFRQELQSARLVEGRGAFRFATPAMVVARVDLELDPVTAVERIDAIGVGVDGAVVAEWELRRATASAPRRTLTLRCDRDTATARRRSTANAPIAEVHLVVRLARGASATVTVHRCAFVSAGDIDAPAGPVRVQRPTHDGLQARLRRLRRTLARR
jgi:SAM-dependent methyltransferase